MGTHFGATTKEVADDIPMKADEGDYILPYETVILVGLKDLNRYAREAIKLAMANNVDLGGTDIDPTDDVPIKISNYEYHIPKQLVPFFGGGKKYLDKLRQEGLELRQRLEEEGNKGVAVLVEANHMCACVRGVKHDATMKTAKLSGEFMNYKSNSRDEFYNFIKEL